jgi:Ca2+/Na+ antiporter
MMFGEVVQWIVDETLLQNLIHGLPTIVLVATIAFCILLLSKGANWMIDGVVHLARRTGLPRIVIGATIIYLCTTMPEAFVSMMAAWMGNPGLALGNGVESIIADTGLIFVFICILIGVPVYRFRPQISSHDSSPGELSGFYQDFDFLKRINEQEVLSFQRLRLIRISR